VFCKRIAYEIIGTIKYNCEIRINVGSVVFKSACPFRLSLTVSRAFVLSPFDL
jgi:hypothetical protein